MRIYAIKDVVAQLFHRPFYERTDQTALRALRQEVNRPDANNPLYTQAGDLSVYYIGTFNEDTGEISPEKPHKLADCSTLVENKNAQ